MVYQTNSRQDTLIKKKGTFLDESEQTVTASIKTLGAHIEHSARNNYRPYLMMYGQVVAVAFPNGLFQTFLPQTHLHIRYEFSDAELASLSQKGLFYDGFQVPDIISDNPNIEIPMTATAKRYQYNNDVYVTLDLASADIYKTDTQECHYVFADYFEDQVPSKLETEQPMLEDEKDDTLSFDEDFAKQFEKDFGDTEDMFETTGDELNKITAQEKHKQSLITAEAQKLLEKSPTAERERQRAAEIGKKIASERYENDKRTSLPDDNDLENSGLIDDEFAAFRQAQESEMDSDNKHLKNLTDIRDQAPDIDHDASTHPDEVPVSHDEDDEEEKDAKDLSTVSDVSVSVKVDGLENDEDKRHEPDMDPEEHPFFGNELEDAMNQILGKSEDEYKDSSDPEDSKIHTKEDVERELANISTKSNPNTMANPQDQSYSDDISYDNV